MSVPGLCGHRSIPFTKMTGSGNDFVLVDNRDGILDDSDVVPFTRAVCRRGLGLGADGVLLIDHPTRADTHFRWTYINADGSPGEMCGNGAMCGARFAVRAGIAPESCRFETAAGVVEARVPDNGESTRVDIRLAAPPTPATTTEIDVDGETWSFHSLRVGVPHVVTWVANADSAFDAAGFDSWGRTVRHHEAFAPDGTNVNLVSIIDDRTIRMRTWERGVEAETLACGTGAVASALAGIASGLLQSPVRVVVSSDESLTVTPDDTGVWLGGSARYIARGFIDPELPWP
ncbi:MAG TPA: diaminopimelate epimerase [Thermomicrobiales bacterium]|nr:diaminopimelate epimerase [Thermomicrobiales bacterium]